MNTIPPADDKELRTLLRTWEVEPRHDTGLARRIWARIEAEKPAESVGWVESLARLFARPAMAVAAVALFATFGALAGEWKHVQEHEARVAQLAAEYARSIDPILMTHPAEHAGHTP